MPTPKEYRPGRTDRRFREARVRVIARSKTCAWCGKPLRPDLRTPHDWSTEADHDPPLSALIASGQAHRAADERGLYAIHRRCNLDKGIQPLANAPCRQRTTSRDW